MAYFYGSGPEPCPKSQAEIDCVQKALCSFPCHSVYRMEIQSEGYSCLLRSKTSPLDRRASEFYSLESEVDMTSFRQGMTTAQNVR